MKKERRQLLDAPNYQAKTSVIREMIVWWERKRAIYNLIIVGLSIFLLYDFWDYPWRKIVGAHEIIIDAFQFSIVMNVLYTLGWGLGVLSHFLFKTGELNPTGRWLFFTGGTLLSIIFTFFYFVILFDALFAY